MMSEPKSQNQLQSTQTTQQTDDFQKVTCKYQRAFLGTNGKTISIKDPALTLQDLNEFVKKWMAGDFRDIETLNIAYSKFLPCRPEILYDGIQMTTWNYNARPRYHGTVHCGCGVDVKRADGTLATIFASQIDFQFLVWSEKYLKPDEKENH